MNCRTFAKGLYDYLDGTLTAQEKAEFELHRSGCARCAALMESESQAAQAVRAAVVDACQGLDLNAPVGARFIASAQARDSRPSRVTGWRIAAAVAALLILALLIPAVVRKPVSEPTDSASVQSGAGESDRWAQEIHVTYETGLLTETTLISRDSGVSTIIEIQVAYHP